MNEQNDNPTPNVDPLAGAAGGWEAPKYPLLAPDQTVRLEITESKIETASDSKIPGFQMLVLRMKTTKDYRDRDSKTLRSGFSTFKRIGITEVPETDTKRGRSTKDIGAELAMILKAVGFQAKSPRDLINNPSMLKGQIIDMRVGIAKGKDGFADSNTFSPVPPA